MKNVLFKLDDKLTFKGHEPRRVRHGSFDETQIKGDLENLDRLSNKIKRMLEGKKLYPKLYKFLIECYKTLEDSAKKTQDLNEIFESADNQHTREVITMHQDNSFIL